MPVKNNTRSPIALFAFNRLDTLQRTLECLSKCENLKTGGRISYAFIDGPRRDEDIPKIKKVRECIEQFRKCNFSRMEIIERETNFSNPKNMPLGISQVLENHGRIIVIEDDILVSRYFLSYMDEALDSYVNDPRIWCINAWRSRFIKIPSDYCYDVYLNNRNMCWGWGTWRDRWEAVDLSMPDYLTFKSRSENVEALNQAGIELIWMLDSQFKGELHAWDVQCSYHMIKNHLWAVEPRYALTKNIGFKTDCDHCSSSNTAITTARYYNFMPILSGALQPDERIVKQFKYAAIDPRLFARIYRKFLRILWGIGPEHNRPIDIC